MARASVGRALVRAPKRRMVWCGDSFGRTVTTDAVFSDTIVTEAELENFPNPTLIRIRGEVTVAASASSGAASECMIGLGIIFQSNRSIAAGVGGMPTPVGNIGSKWIWVKQIPIFVRSVIGDVDSPAQVTRFEIDNKSMRKANVNEGLVFVSQNVAINLTTSVRVTVGLRFLFKLP